MVLRLVSSRGPGFYLRGTVRCANCLQGIHVFGVGDLTEMFEAQCVECGHLDAYPRNAVHAKLVPERRATREAIAIALH